MPTELYEILNKYKTIIMEQIKTHVLRTGEVRVSPYLPFGGDNCNLLKASGITTPRKKWLWLPVYSYLIEHPKGLVLFDTGWHREMSPQGVFDKKAQIRSLGSWFLYQVNQGRIAAGERGARVIEIEAQCYATGFYKKTGFEECSREFMPDGIPHVRMKLEL